MSNGFNGRYIILADIEGSSGCFDRRGSAFLTPEWALACRAMTLDVNAAIKGLFAAGAVEVTVHDFHRTGYNLLRETLDSRVRLVSGYRRGTVPGVGNPALGGRALFLGMHAASGTNGFLAHTFTSRIEAILVNGRPVTELELFSAALSAADVSPLFFSGCPNACGQAKQAIPGIFTFAIDKSGEQEMFDAASWRSGLEDAVTASATAGPDIDPFNPVGPFWAEIWMRDGERAARKHAKRWGLKHHGPCIPVLAADMKALFSILVDVCYLTPALKKALPPGLALHRCLGRAGLAYVRYCLRRSAE